MPGAIATLPRLKFTDLSGAPLASGTLTTYLSGSTTKTPTWQDQALTILNTNPIVLDANGSCIVWLDNTKAYKIVLADKNGVVQWTQSNVVGGGVDASVVLNAALIQSAVDASAVSASASEASRQAVDSRFYPGIYTVAPTARPNASARQEGDQYSSATQSYIFRSGAWANYEATSVAKASESASSATASESSRQASGVSAGLAATAKTASEAARDAAQLSAGVYATTAAGIAATTSGKYFSVPSADSAEYLILYLNNTGVAVEQKRYPASAALDFKQKTTTDILQIADTDGNLAVRLAAGATLNMQAAFEVDVEGNIRTPGREISNHVLRWKEVHADGDGNVLYGIDEQGRLVANFATTPKTTPITSSFKRGGTYDYEVNHVFTYGQSLAVGEATPVVSTVQQYDNVMFTRGMIPQYSYTGETSAQWYASLIPAIEAQSPTVASLAETPSMGAGDAIKERILAEDGLAFNTMKYQLLLSAPGYGATTIGQLSKGTPHYQRMIDQATFGLSLANAAGKTYAAQAVTWTQGESDYAGNNTQAAYVTSLNTLVTDFNLDFKAVTGQVKSIPLISYQVAAHKLYGSAVPTIALGQLEVEASNALVYISTPMYHFEYAGTSNPHLTSVSSRWLGAYHGLAYKRIVIDKVDWKPCKPLSSIKQGATAMVTFHVPVGRLTLDTTNVAARTNFGFELVDSAGTALTISSVSVTGPDTVKVVAASTIPAGAKLRYAWSCDTIAIGTPYGPRGNLRDSQGDTIIFDPQGINKPMHNWCVIFEIGL